jgi:hypothetical protein
METYIIKESITRTELKKIAQEGFGDMVKAVVDIEKGIMALSGELHIDEQIILIEQEGSKQKDTWGINLYPNSAGDEFIEFDSMVNIKPQIGHKSRSVESTEIQQKIKAIVTALIQS